MASICTGSGQCLTQSSVNSYSTSPQYTCEHNCLPFPCPNTLIFGSQHPKWFHDLKSGFCTYCHMTFRRALTVLESEYCPICLDTKVSVVMPTCSHSICVDCFKRITYGMEVPKPPFPYSREIETEWEEGGSESPEWCSRYPLIEIWESECAQCDEETSEAFEREDNLRRCPLCRESMS